MSRFDAIKKLIPPSITVKQFALGSSRFEAATNTKIGKAYRLRVLTESPNNKSNKHITLLYKPPFSVFVTADYERGFFFKGSNQSKTVDHIVNMNDRRLKVLQFVLRNVRNETGWRKFKDEFTFVVRHPKLVVLLAETLGLTGKMTATLNKGIIEANDAYHNTGKSLLTDAEFDAWEAYYKDAEIEWPLKGKVGAKVKVEKGKRGLKQKLPVPMGSLEKLFSSNDIHLWAKKHKLNQLIATPKFDGISCQLEYKDGKLVGAYKRGDGVEGFSILSLVMEMDDVPKKIKASAYTSVRGEIAMPNDTFAKYSKANGGDFENARNMVAGIFNKVTIDKETKDKLKDCLFYAYSIREVDADNRDKDAQLIMLRAEKFTPIPYMIFVPSPVSMSDGMLESKLKEWKADLDIELDGIVVEAVAAKTRQKIGFETNSINPRFARAWKPANVGIKTKVLKVTYKISRHGVYKPVVWIKPIKAGGVTIKKATGHNAGNIRDEGIGPGAIVTVYRSGDVIPYIDKVLKPVKPQLPPAGAYTWNATKVDAISTDTTTSEILEGLVHFFKVLKVEYFSRKTLAKLVDKGFNTPYKIFKMGPAKLALIERMSEKTADKVFVQLRKFREGVPAYKLMYALNSFGSNFGTTKLKAIVDHFGEPMFKKDSKLWQGKLRSQVMQMIAGLRGFSYETAKIFVRALDSYIESAKELRDYITPVYKVASKGSKMKGKVVVFTGIRDQETHDWIESQGGKVSSSVSSNTTILISADPSTLKSKKAKSLGVEVVTLEAFKKKYM